MIVIDASALVVAVVEAGERGRAVRRLLDDGAAAPHLVDAEVGQAVRGLVLRDVLDEPAGSAALGAAHELVTERHTHRALSARAWALRANVSYYDGLYVSLAEALALPLVTVDRRLAAAVPTGCDVRAL